MIPSRGSPGDVFTSLGGIILTKRKTRVVVVRWISRITGVLLVGLFLLFLIGEGFNPWTLRGMEIAQHTVLWIALLGMLVLWRWEAWGGGLVIAGMIAFYFIQFATSGRLPGGPVFPLCFVPGVLALIGWWGSRKNPSSSEL